MLDKIDHSNLSYIIGFLQGDGAHSKEKGKKGRIRIELSKKDIDILDKIEVILSKIVKVSRSNRIRNTNFKNKYESVILSIFDYDFRQAILPYVPIGKKSDIIEFPFLLPNFSKRSYIRGLIDSDGSIGISTNNRPFISLCVSSENIKQYLVKDIEEIIGLKKEIQRNARDNIYNIMLNNEEAIQYAKYLYEDSNLYLNRKYEEYKKFNNWKRSNNKRLCEVKKWCSKQDKIILDENLSLEEKMHSLGRTKKSITSRMWRLKNKFIPAINK